MLEMSLADIIGNLIAIVGLSTIAGAMGYASGFKDGHRQGYTRGRSIVRHVAGSKVVKK